MLVSVVNRSTRIHDRELQGVLRAINRQINEDFAPYWSFGGTLRLEGKVGHHPDKQRLSELRGDAVIYLWDTVDVENALGYHDHNNRGIPFGFVFPSLSEKLGEPWSVTLSHEALELIADPQGNLLVLGPDPRDNTAQVFHWFEMCDAVQSQTYRIDDVAVANFLLPQYFTPGEQPGGRNDFLGMTDEHGKTLKSFCVAEGGYIGFYDPGARKNDTYVRPLDDRAASRLRIKTRNGFGRGVMRQHAQINETREQAQQRVFAAAATSPPLPAAAPDPIEHIVVLMLENRSFDHMLGDMTRIDPRVEGVRRAGAAAFQNAKPDGTPVAQQPGALWRLDTNRDLDHEHQGVMDQLGNAQAPMSGFVKDFIARYPDATKAQIDQVMAYFAFGDKPADDALPVLHGLAREFAVCDHWFSSMPGPTWQNRFFAHSGTCLGHLLMPSHDAPQNLRIYYQDTIYDRLSDAGIRWTIYHDDVPQSIVLTRLLTRYLTRRGYADMATFFQQAAGDPAGFPQYAFIEPRYFGATENDQHPPSDVRQGEALIAQVYNALRANDALWKSTLLIVLYDEHGGFFDHVPPPATVAPDAYTTEWTFDRLGVRVPAILISPWVERGVVKTVFDHTSILRYLCEKWGLPPLGARMQPSAGAARSETFGPVLRSRTTPRTDTPATLTAAPIPAAPLAAGGPAAEPPIEGAREALLMFIERLPDATPVQEDLTSLETTKAARAPLAATVPLPAGVTAVPLGAVAGLTAGAPAAQAHAAAQAKLERLRASTTAKGGL